MVSGQGRLGCRGSVDGRGRLACLAHTPSLLAPPLQDQALKREVVGLFERFQKFMDAELQQRAAEYLVRGGGEGGRTRAEGEGEDKRGGKGGCSSAQQSTWYGGMGRVWRARWAATSDPAPFPFCP